MKFVQDTIEKKLSQLLNRQVTFERLSVSLLSGQVEAEGMMVAGDEPNQPLLSVLRISAKVAIAKALAGQIVVKSLVIESPAVNLTRKSDGSINLPRFRSAPSDRAENEDADAWELEAQSIQVINGRVSFQDECQKPVYRASAEQINGELNQLPGRMEFKLRVGSIGRRELSSELGPVDVTGTFSSAEKITDLPGSPMRANIQFPDGLRITVDSPGLKECRAEIEVVGSADVSRWLATIPAALVPNFIARWSFKGPMKIHFRFSLDHRREIHLQMASLDAADLIIPMDGIFPFDAP